MKGTMRKQTKETRAVSSRKRQGIKTILQWVTMAGILCSAAIGRAQPIIVANLPIANGLVNVAANPAANKIYLSGGYSAAQQIVVVDGNTLAQTGVGAGMGVDVDVTNNNYWSAGVYSGTAFVWNSSNAALASVSLGYCPGQINMDAPHRRVWVAAQCGSLNDPVWAINADTDAVIAGPIGSGGIQGATMVNPATGRLYLSPNGVSKRVNPSTFAVTLNKFGTVLGVNPVSNLLYAMTNNNVLQIINGAPDPEVVLTNVTLPFSFGGYVGVNPVLNRIYIGVSGTNEIAVLDGRTGHTIETISLGSTVTSVGNIAVDASRSRVYAIAYSGGSEQLYVIGDAPLAISTVLANDPYLKHPAYLSTTDGTSLLVSAGATDNSQDIFRVATDGSTVTKLYTATNPYAAVTVGNDIYWIDPNSGPITDTQILRALASGDGYLPAIYTGSSVGQPIVDGSGLATDGALLYAADEVAGTVFRLNPDGSQLTQLGPARYIGGFGAEHLNTMAVAQSTVFVADSGKPTYSIPPAVLCIPTNGGSFTTLASGAPLVQPSGIAAGDGQVFVSDPGASNTIWQVPASGGSPTVYFTNSNFSRIQGLAYYNGVLYVADNAGGAIYKIGPAEPVAITRQPASATAAPGGTVSSSVGASGWPLSYQWSLNGTNIPGATGSTLTLNNLSAANAGVYTVTISNALGSVTSRQVSVGLLSLETFAGVVLSGPVGAQYSIQSTHTIAPQNWTTLTNITLGAQQPYVFIDYSSPGNSRQFYRAVPLLP
jgi:hypothetical protein